MRSLHASHHPPMSSPPSFVLFPPFVFRSSCCNSADHQQLLFQTYLTLPNPRLSLHPDIANAPQPLAASPRSYQAKTSPFSLARNMFTVNTLSNSSASLLSPRFVLIIVAPVCHHMANDSPRQKRRGESEEVSAWKKTRCVCLQKGQDWEINKNITHAAERDEGRRSGHRSAPVLWLQCQKLTSDWHPA